MAQQQSKTSQLPDGSIGGSFGFGYQQLKKYFLYFFLAVLIGAISKFPVDMFRDVHINPGAGWILLGILAFLYSLLLLPVINYGIDFFFLRGVRDEPLVLKEIFMGFNNYVNIILANLLTAALVIMGLILFVIPGIILACRLVFVSYLVMDRQLDPIRAVEKSWHMTRGYGWKIFSMGVISFFLVIFGLIMMIIGVFFSAMWIASAFASLYYHIDSLEKAALEA